MNSCGMFELWTHTHTHTHTHYMKRRQTILKRIMFVVYFVNKQCSVPFPVLQNKKAPRNESGLPYARGLILQIGSSWQDNYSWYELTATDICVGEIHDFSYAFRLKLFREDMDLSNESGL